tara:strand:+ start:146 stop:475 length:330 start_codon:yes stop_codon:yes gene_type:complete
MNNLEARVDMLEKKLAAANITTPNPPEPTKKAVKKPKDEKVKKTKTSGYILFGKANRVEIVEQMTLENNGNKPTNPEVMTEVAKHWRELSDDDKKPYLEQAEQIKNQEP